MPARLGHEAGGGSSGERSAGNRITVRIRIVACTSPRRKLRELWVADGSAVNAVGRADAEAEVPQATEVRGKERPDKHAADHVLV